MKILILWPWEPKQCAIFVAKYFLETRLSCESLDPLIDFLAYHEPNFWLTNQKLDINSNPTKGTIVIMAKSRNSPADCVRELFKPSKDSESLVVWNKKFFLVLGLGFLVDDVRMEVGFAFFG